MRNLILCAVFGLFVAGFQPFGAPAAQAGGLDFTRLGGWTEGYCGAMEVEGHTVHLANGAWLEEVDVSDPAAPLVRSSVELSAGIVDLARIGGRTCALTADGVLHVVRDDWSRGARVGSCRVVDSPTSALIAGINVVGSYIYVNDVVGLRIVDIPASGPPRVVRNLDHPLGPYALYSAAATGNTLYLGDVSTSWIFDVSDPLQPVPVRELGGQCDRLTINDGLLNTSYGYNSELWDIAEPMAPRRILGDLEWDPGWIPGFAVHDTLLYVAAWNLAVYSRAGRQLSGGVAPAWDMEEMESEGDHLFARQKGLTILGLSDPFAPAVVGRHRTGFALRGLQIAGDRAYLAGDAGRLTVMDVADPDRPALLGAWVRPDEPTVPWDKVVSVNGGRALVANGGGGGWILDVTDPAAIRPATAEGLPIVAPPYGSSWAIAAGTGWFVSGQTTPLRLSLAADGRVTTTPVDLPAYPCEVSPGVYVGSRRDGDRSPGVWLAENGGDPQRVADLVAGVEAQPLGWHFAASGDIAYGLDLQFYSPEPDSFAFRLVVAAFDLSEPQSPRFLGRSFLPLDAARAFVEGGSQVTADGSLLYIWSPYHAEIAVLDARDPGNVVLCGSLWAGDGIVGVTIAQDRLVVATRTGGFRTYARPSPPGGHVAAAPPPAIDLALRAVPNPFNPATRVTFRLPRAGQAEVDVFDLGGRRVRRLHAGVLAAGEHEFTWRGSDDDGRTVAAGSYVVRVRGGGEAMTAKLLLVK